MLGARPVKIAFIYSETVDADWLCDYDAFKASVEEKFPYISVDKVSITAAKPLEMSRFRILLITCHKEVVLPDEEIRKLRLAPAKIWIDNCGGMQINLPRGEVKFCKKIGETITYIRHPLFSGIKMENFPLWHCGMDYANYSATAWANGSPIAILWTKILITSTDVFCGIEGIHGPPEIRGIIKEASLRFLRNFLTYRPVGGYILAVVSGILRKPEIKVPKFPISY